MVNYPPPCALPHVEKLSISASQMKSGERQCVPRVSSLRFPLGAFDRPALQHERVEAPYSSTLNSCANYKLALRASKLIHYPELGRWPVENETDPLPTRQLTLQPSGPEVQF